MADPLPTLIQQAINTPYVTDPTAGRPPAPSLPVGMHIYDTTLSIPIWTDGTVWRNAAGTAV